MLTERSVKADKIKIIVSGLFIIIIYSIYYSSIDHYNVHAIKQLGFFALIQLIYILISWKKLTGSIFDAYTIFIVACYAFNLAQPILEIFDAVAPTRSIITHYNWSENIYCEATYISMIFIMAFHFGAITVFRTSSKSNFGYKYTEEYYKIQLIAIYRVSLILAVLSFPGYIYNLIINMILSITEGYGAIYGEDTGRIKLLGLIGEFYVPSLICLLFSSQALHKRKRIIGSIIIFTVFIPPLIIGGRTDAMVIFALILLIYSFFHYINKKTILIWGISTLGILVVFAIIAGNRQSGALGYSSGKLLSEEKGNPILFTLTEMGASVQPLIRTLEIIPNNQDYKYGDSYLYSITTIIPNIGIWTIHPATKHSNLGKWLQEYYNLPFGPGYSIVAEAYYNFGYLGFLSMFFIGCFFTKILLYAQRKFVKYNPLRTVLAVVFLWLTLKIVRNSFEFAVRALVYYYLPMYWLMKYTAKKLYNSYKNRLSTHIKLGDFAIIK